MSAGPPKWRVAEQARRKRACEMELPLTDAHWAEITQYLQQLPPGHPVDYRGIAVWYMKEWQWDTGVCSAAVLCFACSRCVCGPVV